MYPRSSSDADSSLLIPRKVCIIFPASSEEFDYGYDIFIVDSNIGGRDGGSSVDNIGGGGGGSGGGSSVDILDLSPTVRVVGEFFKTAAFCVLGSTLYVFEGYVQGGRRRKSVYSYKLRSGDSNLMLKKSMLVRACGMNDIKFSPTATPTPDGEKIVVFSSAIHSSCSEDRCDFELFDPAVPKCQKLPTLCLWDGVSPRDSVCWIELFTFMDKCLFVQTKRGMYTLDLKPPLRERSWEPFRFGGVPRMKTPFQVIGEDICLTPFCAYDINVPGINELENSICRWFYTFPDSFPSESVRIRNISLLDVNPRDCMFSILQTWIEESDTETDTMHEDTENEDTESDSKMYIPHLILDVYRCDVIECKKELIEFRQQKREEIKKNKDMWERRRASIPLPCTTRVKSLKICLKPQLSRCFFLRHFSAIPAGTTPFERTSS